MSKLCRAREIRRKEGFVTLFNKSLNYIRNKVQYYILVTYYNIKSSLLGSQIVNINDILIDLDHEVFSSAMKNRIRGNNYERSEKILINKHIRRNRPVIDLGGGIGYTACLIDRETNNSTPIIAVEANKSLISVIKRTRDLNQSDFNILYSAYDPMNDSVKFQVADDFWSSSKCIRSNSNQNEVTVPAISLQEIKEKYNIEGPIQLIVDIEGGEHDLFINEQSLLQKKVSLIIFEYHSNTENPFEFYDNILTENGFEFVESYGNVYVYYNTDIN